MICRHCGGAYTPTEPDNGLCPKCNETQEYYDYCENKFERGK